MANCRFTTVGGPEQGSWLCFGDVASRGWITSARQSNKDLRIRQRRRP